MRENERAVMERRLHGMTWTAIAAEVGMSTRGAALAYQRGLSRITIPNAVEAKRELVERCRQVHAKLWAALEKTDDPVAIAALSGRLTACQARWSALVGADVPERLAMMLATEAPDARTEVMVKDLRENLTVDELRELHRLAEKGRGRMIETTAKPTLESAPPFPDADEDSDTSATMSMPPPATPQPPAAPIGETESEREQRLAGGQATPYDGQIEALENQLGWLSADDVVNRRSLETRLTDLRQRRRDALNGDL